MNSLPKSARLLLASSLVFMVGRSAALPFLALYLTECLGLNQQQVGLMLSISLVLATLFGLYAGYLADRFDKRRLMRIATALAALSTLAMILLFHPVAVVAALTCTDAALSLRSIALKASLAELLPPEDRPRGFSLNYTLINVAHSVGPMLGVAVVGFGLRWPFVASAACAMLSLQITCFIRAQVGLVSPMERPYAARPGFKATLSALRNDRRLVLFTIGGLLSAFAYGRFAVYLSQYLLVAQGAAQAAAIMPYLLATNAVAVVLLQYPVSKLIKHGALLRWITFGSLAFVAGLLGFAHATSLAAWMMAMVVFTLGEVIVVPAEYLFIDAIAPDALKGSYYGAQNLTMLGGALNPVLCGALMTHANPRSVFAMLIVVVILGAVMYRAGSAGTSLARGSMARAPGANNS
jgi:MFS family permease